MNTNKRTFLKTALFTTAFSLVSKGDVFASVTPLETLEVLQEDLFPHADNNASAYFSLILKHTKVSDASKKFLRNGAKWLNEEAINTYDAIYTKLSSQKRQKILQIIAKESWGESWLQTVLKYILEATLGDPIYGINKKESGWKWLAHESGQPRPTKVFL
ncbi:gluconate 2-dehydrogenase subunit 3 family protein [Sulfurimonas sp. SAG-AH-194-I05]|nr:gluconate 2-dehydrogenase subunit 3 family protein [Sulfurimonas sp. SAG-AH-194-I05]MDF1874841.1 gluconate 2-dehydrogenase subunit 3 family protein [Sulfurimonas sp. SAG-AH-194-I05]